MGNRSLSHCLDFAFISLDSIHRHYMSQIHDLQFKEHTFLGLKLEPSPSQLIENSLQPFQVFLRDSGTNNDVVKINYALIQLEVLQTCLQEVLKGIGCVGQPKQHAFAFIKPEQTHCERHVSFALFLLPHLPISWFQVQGHKPNHAMEEF